MVTVTVAMRRAGPIQAPTRMPPAAVGAAR